MYDPVLPWGIFYIVSSIGFYCGFLLMAFGLACGLFYLAELAEEYSMLTKSIIRYAIFATIGCHVGMLVFDQISWWRSILSIAAQLVYFQHLAGFPWVNFSSPVFLGSGAVFLFDNISWYTLLGSDYSWPYWSVVSFYGTMVWLVPLALFLSMAVADEQFPGVSSEGAGAGSKRRNFAATLGSLFKFGGGGAGGSDGLYNKRY